MGNWAEILKSVGGIAAILTLGWRVLDEFGSHLRISVKAEGPKDGWVTVLTTVDNKGNRAKDTALALLLVGPEGEHPVTTGTFLREVAGYDWAPVVTADFIRFDKRIGLGERIVIPLPFFYEESSGIEDETLTYRVPIRVDGFGPGAYSVRFFLFPKRKYHRSTQDCFVVPDVK